MRKFAVIWLLLIGFLSACSRSATDAIPSQNGVPYGGSWLLEFTAPGSPGRLFFRVAITGYLEVGSYGVSIECRNREACDMSTKRFIHISTADDRLRVLIYDSKVIIFAAEDADGKPEGGQLSGSASYNSEQGFLEGAFTMTREE